MIWYIPNEEFVSYHNSKWKRKERSGKWIEKPKNYVDLFQSWKKRSARMFSSGQRKWRSQLSTKFQRWKSSVGNSSGVFFCTAVNISQSQVVHLQKKLSIANMPVRSRRRFFYIITKFRTIYISRAKFLNFDKSFN